ncbi:MAG: apolipoprotein N-acyltransferase [Bacteroidetes bacterium GWC2_33_15]|nr:MAG: apolipoprotein N-acyltransferase [Bacteroidetes bacterium GWA2_33_15]OFX51696.1 MAG: apolipoprotein N-acyltransferase [Bacteroidetes bacterium GWC2_33_15]OFX66242.1 MAG: apolipoprotein N-acyltransferase [Bacteroidetes bacterium GWB2_32_14]OFX66996.1 MAG: apolipoprotein N-acyltransferase [Bacteroidetes bacterium GWD2_33_33]HAN17696.1 apolipoprotein N-acyltransferase [Bacteroidales bacterium]
MKKLHLVLLSILSSILLSLPWYQQFSGILLIIAFVPLLFIEDSIYKTRADNKSIVFYGYAALTFGIWNILTTYWVYNAALIGVIAAVLVNTFVLTTTIWLAHFTKRKTSERFGNFALLVYWIGFEYFYLNAEISWPWLNLGNGLAKDIKLIQWYEYTGTLGGTFWILILNLLVFSILKQYMSSKRIRTIVPNVILFSIILIFPIIVSLYIHTHYTEKGKEYNIAVIQPNIDPYNDKFGGMSHAQQLEIMMHLADSISDENTDYVIGPETALDNSIWINNLKENNTIQTIKNFVTDRPRINVVIGIDAYYRYSENEKLSPTSRRIGNSDVFYDAYNSAIQIDTSFNLPIYHKSKLVVGVEKMPYPKLFRLLENLILNLGGTTGSRGTQDYRGTFKHSSDETRIAPVICYESIYGEYVTEYIKNGANFIFVITNDGWWGNTPGYKQHLNYSQLRAIETRRSIARSANTGISAFINQKGEILNCTKWWVPGALENTLKANTEYTFYVRYGDYIGRIASFFALLAILYTLVQVLINKKSID